MEGVGGHPNQPSASSNNHLQQQQLLQLQHHHPNHPHQQQQQQQQQPLHSFAHPPPRHTPSLPMPAAALVLNPSFPSSSSSQHHPHHLPSHFPTHFNDTSLAAMAVAQHPHQQPFLFNAPNNHSRSFSASFDAAGHVMVPPSPHQGMMQHHHVMPQGFPQQFVQQQQGMGGLLPFFDHAGADASTSSMQQQQQQQQQQAQALNAEGTIMGALTTRQAASPERIGDDGDQQTAVASTTDGGMQDTDFDALDGDDAYEDEDDDDEDGEGTSKGSKKAGGKKGASSSSAANVIGRKKIRIAFIEDRSKRHITFSKRKAGIMKKAFELSTLTGTQMLLLVASETGHVYTFSTPKLQSLVSKEGQHFVQLCLNAPEENPLPPGTKEAAAANKGTHMTFPSLPPEMAIRGRHLHHQQVLMAQQAAFGRLQAVALGQANQALQANQAAQARKAAAAHAAAAAAAAAVPKHPQAPTAVPQPPNAQMLTPPTPVRSLSLPNPVAPPGSVGLPPSAVGSNVGTLTVMPGGAAPPSPAMLGPMMAMMAAPTTVHLGVAAFSADASALALAQHHHHQQQQQQALHAQPVVPSSPAVNAVLGHHPSHQQQQQQFYTHQPTLPTTLADAASLNHNSPMRTPTPAPRRTPAGAASPATHILHDVSGLGLVTTTASTTPGASPVVTSGVSAAALSPAAVGIVTSLTNTAAALSPVFDPTLASLHPSMLLTPPVPVAPTAVAAPAAAMHAFFPSHASAFAGIPAAALTQHHHAFFPMTTAPGFAGMVAAAAAEAAAAHQHLATPTSSPPAAFAPFAAQAAAVAVAADGEQGGETRKRTAKEEEGAGEGGETKK
ncbi:hypothetical protein HDU96_002616, partial [Phlyctochytrium bullatum]